MGFINLDDKLDYTEFYGRFIDKMPKILNTGKSENIKCPFPDHEDKNTVGFGFTDISKGKYHCLGCRKSGNAQKFLVHMGICADTKEAYHKIVEMYGLKGEPGNTAYERPPVRTNNIPEPKKLNTSRPVIPESVWDLMPELSIEWIRDREQMHGKQLGWTAEAIEKLDLRLVTHIWSKKKNAVVKVWYEPDRIAIPVRDLEGNLINIREYKPFGLDKEKKEVKTLSWATGYGENALLWYESNPDEWHVICEGERDFITAVSNGMNASMQTAQPEVWPSEYIGLYLGKNIISAGDADKHGLGFNSDTHVNLSGTAKKIVSVIWPDFMGKDPETGEWPDGSGQDLSDYFTVHGGTKESFSKLVLGSRMDVPTFRVARQLDVMSGQAWEILSKNNNPPVIFDSSEGMCRIKTDKFSGAKRMEAVGVDGIRNFLKDKARFVSVKKNTIDDAVMPEVICKDMLAEPEKPVPYLHGIIEHDFFDRDMNLHSQRGYSEKSGFYLEKPKRLEVPAVNEKPTDKEVKEALSLLQEIQHDFPFEDKASKTNDLAAMLQPFVRMAISGPTPAYGFNASLPGEGKSLKVRAISYIVNGGRTPETSECTTDDEWRKTLTALFMDNPEIIWFDNIKRKLDSGSLAKALTALIWGDRILGSSVNTANPIRASFFITGNNLTCSTEMSRRIPMIRMNSKTVSAADRNPSKFRHPDLLKWIAENRGKIIWACLTIVQNWKAKGMPQPSAEVPHIPTYEEWRRVMGGILEAAGVKYFLSNFQQDMADNDEESDAMTQLVNAWWEEKGSEAVKASAIYDLSVQKKIPLDIRGRTEQARYVSFGTVVKKILKGRVFLITTDYESFTATIDKAGMKAGAKLWKIKKIQAVDEGVEPESKPSSNPHPENNNEKQILDDINDKNKEISIPAYTGARTHTRAHAHAHARTDAEIPDKPSLFNQESVKTEENTTEGFEGENTGEYVLNQVSEIIHKDKERQPSLCIRDNCACLDRYEMRCRLILKEGKPSMCFSAVHTCGGPYAN